MTALLLAAVLSADPTGAAAYDALSPTQRGILLEAWKKAVAAAEKDADGKQAEAKRARLSIRSAPRAQKKQATAAAEKAEKVAEDARKRVESLRTNDPPYVPQFGHDHLPEVGLIGAVDSVFLLQKFDARDCLAEVWYSDPRPTVIGGEATVEYETVKLPVLIRSPKIAERAIDNRETDLSGVSRYWRVTGTHTYATAGGSQKTVPVLEPFEWPKPKG